MANKLIAAIIPIYSFFIWKLELDVYNTETSFKIIKVIYAYLVIIN